jgi:hypothetical protein
MERKFNIRSFTKKLQNPDPLYLTRAEKEYILKLMEDNEDYERMLEMFDEREYRKLYLKEERAKRPKLLYPDADEIYRKYFNQRETIELLQQKCLEKDKIILDLHNRIMELTQDT